MIKKIIIGLPQDEIYVGRLQFYTNINGVWRIFDYGSLINETTIRAEYTNLIVESNRATYGVSERYSITNMIKWNANYATDFTSSSTIGELVITFKEPLRVLKSIYYHFYGDPFPYLYIYDEFDNLVYKDDNISSKLVKAKSYNSSSICNDINYYETIGLETEKAFPINTIGSIETTDESHYSDIYEINSCNIDYSIPENTDMRFALSFNNRNTYQIYKDNKWSTINKEDIISNGMTVDELINLTNQEYNQVLTADRTLDFYIGLFTTDSSKSPIIKSIKLNYLKIV